MHLTQQHNDILRIKYKYKMKNSIDLYIRVPCEVMKFINGMYVTTDKRKHNKALMY